MNHIVMATHTVVLENPTVLSLDHDWFLKVLRREGLGVVIAVLSLGDIFRDEGMWQVAIDTTGNGVVARLLP